jgi:DNA-3-methyladenine glycosylase II
MQGYNRLIINAENLITATEWLAERDDALALVLNLYGYPPLWARQPGFATLVHIILEQQVSLVSANAAYERLKILMEGIVMPEVFLTFSDETLKAIGYSRQKTLYTRHLANAILQKDLDLDALQSFEDETVSQTLKQLKGIGDWTADIYLSECLLRPDILPKGDIAMLEAFKVLKKLPERPTHEVFVSGTEHWRPWRSIGTRMLWHYYLSERKRKN